MQGAEPAWHFKVSFCPYCIAAVLPGPGWLLQHHRQRILGMVLEVFLGIPYFLIRASFLVLRKLIKLKMSCLNVSCINFEDLIIRRELSFD